MLKRLLILCLLGMYAPLSYAADADTNTEALTTATETAVTEAAPETGETASEELSAEAEENTETTVNTEAKETESESETTSEPTSQAPAASETSEEQSENNDKEIVLDVFPIEFMNSMRSCQPAQISKDTHTLAIVQKESQYCLLKYDDFELRVPYSVVGNIHSFEDLTPILKNQDITSYNYTPDYDYGGLMYAVNACFNRTDYYGTKNITQTEKFTLDKEFYAEFRNDICVITLSNIVTVGDIVINHNVTCSLPYTEVTKLEEYIKDLIAQYGEKREFSADGRIVNREAAHNNETRQADIALMYYIQQNGFCNKNN